MVNLFLIDLRIIKGVITFSEVAKTIVSNFEHEFNLMELLFMHICLD